jgi:hypothetical protein
VSRQQAEQMLRPYLVFMERMEQLSNQTEACRETLRAVQQASHGGRPNKTALLPPPCPASAPDASVRCHAHALLPTQKIPPPPQSLSERFVLADAGLRCLPASCPALSAEDAQFMH